MMTDSDIAVVSKPASEEPVHHGRQTPGTTTSHRERKYHHAAAPSHQATTTEHLYTRRHKSSPAEPQTRHNSTEHLYTRRHKSSPAEQPQTRQNWTTHGISHHWWNHKCTTWYVTRYSHAIPVTLLLILINPLCCVKSSEDVADFCDNVCM